LERFATIAFSVGFGLLGFFAGMFLMFWYDEHSERNSFVPAIALGLCSAIAAGYFLSKTIRRADGDMKNAWTVAAAVMLSTMLWVFGATILH